MLPLGIVTRDNMYPNVFKIFKKIVCAKINWFTRLIKARKHFF